MKYREWKIKLLMNLFPPLWINRIKVVSISPGYRQIDVRLRKSILNRNFSKSIFGGSIFSAGDPYYAIMYWQIFEHAGIPTEAWLKSAEIDYIKPARKSLSLQFRLSEEEIENAKQEIISNGRFEKWHTIKVVDSDGENCAEIRTLVHLRRKIVDKKNKVNF